MDTGKRRFLPNPRDKANFFSVLFFSWTYPFFRKGYHKVLGVEDVYQPCQVDGSELLGQRLERLVLVYNK